MKSMFDHNKKAMKAAQMKRMLRSGRAAKKSSTGIRNNALAVASAIAAEKKKEVNDCFSS